MACGREARRASAVAETPRYLPPLPPPSLCGLMRAGAARCLVRQALGMTLARLGVQSSPLERQQRAASSSTQRSRASGSRIRLSAPCRRVRPQGFPRSPDGRLARRRIQASRVRDASRSSLRRPRRHGRRTAEPAVMALIRRRARWARLRSDGPVCLLRRCRSEESGAPSRTQSDLALQV